MSNPLLLTDEFPRYDLIKAEHFVPAIKQVIKDSKETFKAVVALKGERTFLNTILPMMDMDEKVGKVIMPMSQLFSLMASKEVKEEFQKVQTLITEFYNELSMDEDNYRINKEYMATKEAKSFTGERKRYLETLMKNFKLSGAELNDIDKTKLKEINMKLSDLSLKFSNNVIDSTFNLEIKDEKDLEGLNKDIITGAKTKAESMKDEIDPETKWVFNLDMPSYLPFMKFSAKDELRKTIWNKFMTRAIADGKDNRPIIKEILELKLKKANLLGFKTYANLSLESKMAKSPEEVETFLSDIATKVEVKAKEEINEIKELMEKTTGTKVETVMPWQMGYWSNKLKEQKYSYDENQVKEYFKVDNCMNGLFGITNKIYGIRFETIDGIPTWHKDVKTYKIIDENDELRAYVYVDLYPRTGLKRGGAWMNQFVSGKNDPNGKVIPQVGVHCNFTEAVGDKPALLTYNELQTLFHEFGHALHGALSKTELSATSGANTLWDVVELPSQFMENFVRNSHGLKLVARHYKTDEPMPKDLMGKLLKSNEYMEATTTRGQISYGMFDMTLHHDECLDGTIPDAHAIQVKTQKKYSMSPYVEGTYFEAAFSHIFAGGYSAGYYGYMWAQILDSDAFSLFEEKGNILDREAGRSFMTNILEKGDSEDMNVLFEKFRGRPFNDKALLKRLGIK